MRVRLASFFTGAAAASFLGLYTLHKDYKVPHQSFTQQVHINFPSFFFYYSYFAFSERFMFCLVFLLP
ncbi:hypothetical protein AAZX31_04G133800 [Glycine max]